MRSLPIIFAIAIAPIVFDFLPAQLAAPRTSQVVLQGQLSCGKCDLGESPDCIDVLEHKSRSAKSRVYFAGTLADGECHSNACRSGQREIRLTGIPYRREGKNWIAPIRVESVSTGIHPVPVTIKKISCSY